MTKQSLNTLINSYTTVRFDGLKLLVSKDKNDIKLGKQLLKISNELEQLLPSQIKNDLH